MAFLDGTHVGVCLLVEQLQEQTKVLGISFMRRTRKQQKVARFVAQQLAQLVALALVLGIARRHAVGFVHDHQIPVLRLPDARKHVVQLGQVHRGDDLVVLVPDVDGIGLPQARTGDEFEIFSEAVLHLAPPLKGQIGRTHHQDPLHQPPQLQFFEQQPGHDGLTGTGVVRQQKAAAPRLEHVVVNGIQLVG
jgi:hypothetical protein